VLEALLVRKVEPPRELVAVAVMDQLELAQVYPLQRLVPMDIPRP